MTRTIKRTGSGVSRQLRIRTRARKITNLKLEEALGHTCGHLVLLIGRRADIAAVNEVLL